MSWKITPKMLEDAEACGGPYRKFRREWPKGMLVTKKNLRAAVKAGFDCELFGWAVEELLCDEAWAFYDAKIGELLGDADCAEKCRKCELIVNAFYATVKKFRSV